MNLRKIASPWYCIFTLILFTAIGCKSGTDAQLAMKQARSLGAGTLSVRSSAFGNGQMMGDTFAKTGGNTSPPLEWTGTPPGTKEFVLIVEDPDAKTPAPFVHWIAFNIPGGARGLPADSGQNALVGQGQNSAKGTGYTGPNPPDAKPHRYVFQLFALNAPSGAGEGVTRDAMLQAMSGKIIATGSTMGLYQKKKAE